jgi:hypothetical protein
MTLKEARGLIPRHPNCRCSPIPANLGESTAGQVRGKQKVERAIDESIRREIPKRSKRTLAEQKALTRWGGADKRIAKRRPKGVMEKPAVRPRKPSPPKAERPPVEKRASKTTEAAQVPRRPTHQQAEAYARKHLLQEGGTFNLKGLSPDRMESVLRGIVETIGTRNVKLREIAWGKPGKRSLGTYYRHEGKPGWLHFQRTNTRTTTAVKQRKAHEAYQRRQVEHAASRVEIAKKQRVQDNIQAAESLERSVGDIRATTRYNTIGDAEDPLFAVAAHESSHAVYFQGRIRLPISGATDSIHNQWVGALNRHGVTKRERLIVSEYAYHGGAKELFAEVGSLVAQGRSGDVPAKVLAAYREVMEKWLPEVF